MSAARGARRYHDPAPCPSCGRLCATLVPWHGDGSLALIVTHGPRRARCEGSRAVPDGYDPWGMKR